MVHGNGTGKSEALTFENKWLGKNQALIKKLNEADIEKAVVSYAKRRSYVVDKFTSPAKRSVPDRLFIAPNGIIFFIEFKAPGKKPTRKQEEDHAKRRTNRALVYVIDNIEEGKKLIDFFLQI